MDALHSTKLQELELFPPNRLSFQAQPIYDSNCMIEVLSDVRAKLEAGLYKNEEHIRVAVVTRILQALGWDVWNPAEVFPEFIVVPKEDSTRVDIALFLTGQHPSVFIEVKAHKQLMGKLAQVETQVRDYNRNNTAPFSILTDGQHWRFYFSQTGGEFAQKCFQDFDLSGIDLDDAAAVLQAFLSKTAHAGGTAIVAAQELLHLTQKQKTVLGLRDEAKKLTEVAPYPRLPEALQQLAASKGIVVTLEEVADILDGKPEKARLAAPNAKAAAPAPIAAAKRPVAATSSFDLVLDPLKPIDLSHTKATRLTFNGIDVRNWNSLAQEAIKFSYKKGGLQVIRMFANVSETKRADSGFKPVAGIPLWSQFMDANKCWATAVGIAAHYNVPVEVEFFWRAKENVAHGGKTGLLKWSPE